MRLCVIVGFMLTYSCFSESWMFFQQSNSPLVSNFIRDICVDKNNRVWVATDSFLINFHNNQWNIFDNMFNNKPGIYIKSIALDSANNVWFVFDQKETYSSGESYCGLIKYDGTQFSIDTLKSENLSGILQLEFDMQGNKWMKVTNKNENIGSEIIIITKDSTIRYNKNNININFDDIHQIKIHNNEAWLPTRNYGIVILEVDDYKVINMENSNLPTNDFFCVLLDSSDMLLGTDLGIIRANYKIEVDTIIKSINNPFINLQHVTSIEKDNKENIWYTTNNDTNSLIRSKDNNYRVFNATLPNGFNLRYPQDIAFDKLGNTWIGMSFDGIAVYNDTNIVLSVLQEKNNYVNSAYSSPNPFSESTTINFNLEANCEVRLSVFNFLGQEIAVLLEQFLPAGPHSVKFDGTNLPQGTYFYKLQASGEVRTGKVLLIDN